MNPVNLRLRNLSYDTHNGDILIFLKNEVKNPLTERYAAWRVIKNCGFGMYHDFELPVKSQVTVRDSYGNFTKAQEAQPGDEFRVIRSTSGTQLERIRGKSTSPFIVVRNELETGAVGVSFLKGGQEAYFAKNVAPGQQVEMQFQMALSIAMVSSIEEGRSILTAIVEEAQTISLTGIESATIVKRGGGPGAKALPISFSLERIEYL